IRLHASRGSMSLGESRGGLPPDSVVESEGSILADSPRGIATYDAAEPRGDDRDRGGAMLAFLGDSGPDARIGGAGAGLPRPPPHPSGRDSGRGAFLAGGLSSARVC